MSTRIPIVATARLGRVRKPILETDGLHRVTWKIESVKSGIKGIGLLVAAIYCRVSTEAQESEGSSLESQRDACFNKAGELGYTVPEDIVFLETWTGADTDRPKLNQLRDMIRHKAVQALVCHSTDRLARNPIHLAIIAEECEKKGVELVFVTEPLDKSPEGALIRYVKGYAAQVEREKIRERSLRGKREKARQGKLSTGGPSLYGYAVVNGKRMIDESQAEVVRRIFNWFAREGYTLYRAVKELNRLGIPAKRGGRWHEQGVYYLIINPAYKGVTYAFRYKVENKSHVLTDRSQWIEVPGATPAIVSPEIFDAAQERMKRNKLQSNRNASHRYLLGNRRLVCGVCGHTMGGACKRKKKGDWLYYQCIRNVKSDYYEKCPQPGISASTVEPAVWNEVMKVLSDPAIVVEEINKRHSRMKPQLLEAEEMLVTNRLAKVRKEEERYVRLYGQEHIDEGLLRSLLSEVQKKREQLEKQLKVLRDRRQKLSETELDVNNLTQWLGVLSQQLENADFDTKRLALEALDIRAILYPDGRLVVKGLIPESEQLIYRTS